MKKILLLFVTGVVLGGCSDSCEYDGRIWDFSNYSMQFYISDPQGNDLLDPKTEWNLLGNDIKVLYKGKPYRIEPATRATMPLDLALRIYKYPDTPYSLAFGEFAPGSYRKEEFTLDLGSGESYNIAFDLLLTWNCNDPQIEKNLYVEDKLQNDEWFRTELVYHRSEALKKALPAETFRLDRLDTARMELSRLYIVHNEPELEPFIDGEEMPEIDFDAHSLFLVRGTAQTNVTTLSSRFYLDKQGLYHYYLDVVLGNRTEQTGWVFACLVPRLEDPVNFYLNFFDLKWDLMPRE